MNCLGWLDLYTATIIIDNSVMKPTVMQTTAVLENIAEENIKGTE